MPVTLGSVFPDFKCETTLGSHTFHEFLETEKDTKPWTVFFSHPADFTPVCTTELGRCNALLPEFAKRGVKLIGLSCDPVESHKAWGKDVCKFSNQEGDLGFPIIADANRDIAVTLGMIDPAEQNAAGIALPARALFIIDGGKKMRLSILYPATTGRNFDEILRCIDSLMLTTHSKVATPVDWKKGERCVVVPSIKTDDARPMFNNLSVAELPSGKEYLRLVDMPEIKYPAGA